MEDSDTERRDALTWTQEHDDRLDKLEQKIRSFNVAGASCPKLQFTKGDCEVRLKKIRTYFENFDVVGPNVESNGNIFSGIAVNQICP